MSADILHELAYAKAVFQLRAIEAIIQAPASAMSAGTAETEGLRAKPASAVPHVDEADARNVSRNLSSNNSRKV